MLILFDQGTPVGIRGILGRHVVKTAFELDWSTLSNGELLNEAEKAGFEVLLTTDKNLIHQQNLKDRRIGVVILGTTKWSLIMPMLEQIRHAVETAKPGTYTVLSS